MQENFDISPSFKKFLHLLVRNSQNALLTGLDSEQRLASS